MSEKPIRIPGPDHPITVERNPGRVVVKLDGRVVADTRDALTLREASYPPVQYIPRNDVDMSLLARTDHGTYCPYKGDASYYSIAAGGERSKMPSGPMRIRMTRSVKSRTTWRSIRTGWIRSRKAKRQARNSASAE